MIRDETAMPTQQRVGLHHEDGPAVTTNDTRYGGEDRAIVGLEPRTRNLASEYSELMAQHEDLDILGTIRSNAQHENVENQSDKTVETGHVPIIAASEPRHSQQRVTAGHHTGRISRHPQATEHFVRGPGVGDHPPRAVAGPSLRP